MAATRGQKKMNSTSKPTQTAANACPPPEANFY